MQIKDIQMYSKELSQYPPDTELDSYVIIKAPEPWHTNTNQQPKENTRLRTQSFCVIFTHHNQIVAISDRGHVSIQDAEFAINKTLVKQAYYTTNQHGKRELTSQIMVWNPPACQYIIVDYHRKDQHARIHMNGRNIDMDATFPEITRIIEGARYIINYAQIIRQRPRKPQPPQESTEKSRYARLLAKDTQTTWTPEKQPEYSRDYLTDQEYHTGITPVTQERYNKLNQ
jgi:hypothetical protein